VISNLKAKHSFRRLNKLKKVSHNILCFRFCNLNSTMTRSFGKSSLDRRNIETPTLTRLDAAGLVNHGYDHFSQSPSPSFFYIDTSGNWMDGQRSLHRNQYAPGARRFTESWIELEQAYSCGSSVSNKRACCSNCCTKCLRALVCTIILFCAIGILTVIAAILYMEIFYTYFTSGSSGGFFRNMISFFNDHHHHHHRCHEHVYLERHWNR
jgi:hypothetical protein